MSKIFLGLLALAATVSAFGSRKDAGEAFRFVGDKLVPTRHVDLQHEKYGDAASSQFYLYMFNETGGSTISTTHASCIDSSPYGIYISPGVGANASNWLFYVQGGGWVYNPAELYGRSFTTIGSSKQWPSGADLAGFYSSDCNINPVTCNWSKIYFPYCSGDSFSAIDQVITYNNGTANVPLYMTGWGNLAYAMNALLDNTVGLAVPYSSANNVIFSGCSAGGLATYLHADEFGETFANHITGRYVAAPISGFFLPIDNVLQQPIYFSEINGTFQMIGSTDHLNADCVASFSDPADAWQCMFAPITYPFIKTPTFPFNSQMDSWQMGCIVTSTYVDPTSLQNGNCTAAPGFTSCGGDPMKCTDSQFTQAFGYFSQNFLKYFTASSNAKVVTNGAFINTCFTHCEACSDSYYSTFAIGGVTMSEAFTTWYNAGGAAPANGASFFHYDCVQTAPASCNPTCPSNSF